MPVLRDVVMASLRLAQSNGSDGHGIEGGLQLGDSDLVGPEGLSPDNRSYNLTIPSLACGRSPAAYSLNFPWSMLIASRELIRSTSSRCRNTSRSSGYLLNVNQDVPMAVNMHRPSGKLAECLILYIVQAQVITNLCKREFLEARNVVLDVPSKAADSSGKYHKHLGC